MRRSKRRRIFLAIVTGAMALAGTGLTLANNWSTNFQKLAIAITLAACFTAAEAVFLWAHKESEDATRLWRKITLGISMGVLVLSMGFALSEELKLALKKIQSDSLASSSATIVQSAGSRRAQVSLGNKALDEIFENKVTINALPFIICYIITGIASIVILGVGEKEKARTITYGNQIPHNPALKKYVQQIGFNPETAKAYRDNRERGHAIHDEGRYRKFVSDTELSKYS